MSAEAFFADPLRLALFVTGVAAAIIAASIIGRWFARRKLLHWAKQESFQLIEFRGVPFWRSPRGLMRNDENHDEYEVVVIDRQGVRREGMVLFSRPWHGFGPEDVEVRWDET
jgi:hypothetical protein